MRVAAIVLPGDRVGEDADDDRGVEFGQAAVAGHESGEGIGGVDGVLRERFDQDVSFGQRSGDGCPVDVVGEREGEMEPRSDSTDFDAGERALELVDEPLPAGSVQRAGASQVAVDLTAF